jgi:uncharacterized protein DUF6011
MNNTLTSRPTARQTAFLTRLLDEAVELLDRRDNITGCEWPEARTHVARIRREMDSMGRWGMSAAIDAAMDNNKQLRAELEGMNVQLPAEAPAPPRTFVTTGMYRVNDRIFKVLPSRSSDRHYAKELVGESDGGYAFEYTPGAMRLIRPEHKLTQEQAAEFGRLTGHCCWCGRLLTDPKSIEAGIGPVCAGKFT